MSNQDYGRNPYWAPEHTGRKPSFNAMGAMRLNPEYALNCGLVGLFIFNEGAGAVSVNLADRVNRAITGGSWGKDLGRDVFIASNTSQIISNISLQLDLSKPFSFVCRHKLTTSGNILSRTGSSTFAFSTMDSTGDYYQNLVIYANTSGYYQYYSEYNLIPYGQWDTLTVVNLGIYTGAAADVNFYRGGVKKATSWLSGSPVGGPKTGTDQLIYIGQTQNTSAGQVASYDYIAMYNRALSHNECVEWHVNPWGTPKNPRFWTPSTRTWFVPSAGAPPTGLYGPLLSTQLLNSPLISGRLVQ